MDVVITNATVTSEGAVTLEATRLIVRSIGVQERAFTLLGSNETATIKLNLDASGHVVFDGVFPSFSPNGLNFEVRESGNQESMVPSRNYYSHRLSINDIGLSSGVFAL